ncbi:hypothetical protein BC834DRAFT_971158 [Gloeopeniophorella convolvens]|nr:hypothetical protein BC834DRAFT_971158 [Gloeopeniophorella convolvens]
MDGEANVGAPADPNHHTLSPPSPSPPVLTQAERLDKELADSWLGDPDGLLVFSGLFSATVVVFVVGGNSRLRCNPVDATTLFFAHMSRQLFNMLNGTEVDVSSIPLAPPPLRQTGVSVWINILWLSSMLLSLICTLFVMRLKYWARCYLYLRRHRTRFPDQYRAYADDELGVFRPSVMASLLPVLLTISVFLFFSGLTIFLVHIDRSGALVLISTLAVVLLLPNSFRT